MNDVRKFHGTRLEQLVEMLDISRTEAAAILGITTQTLRRWTQGLQSPTLLSLSAFNALGVDAIRWCCDASAESPYIVPIEEVQTRIELRMRGQAA